MLKWRRPWSTFSNRHRWFKKIKRSFLCLPFL